MEKMKNKVALLIHGWPNALAENSLPVRYFKSKGFYVLAPGWLVLKKPIHLGEVVKTVCATLGDRKPDVIVGFSAGGFIAPHIASLYPESKLILVATGPRIDPKSKKYKFLLKKVDVKFVYPLLKTAKLLPPERLRKIYEKMYPNNTDLDAEEYRWDMNRNLDAIRNVDECLRDNTEFIRTVDNTKFLTTVTNKTLVLSGDEDPLMPVELGQELNRLIKNSELHTVHASHFDVFNTETTVLIDKFLE
jgi:pimeloyl-ACP methyl ester carboxylesterase